jgi:hypothetical protein
MKLAFQGSRSLKKKEEEVLKIIDIEMNKYNPEMVITSGEPDGVCRLAQLYCKRNGITLKLYHLNCKKYAKGAFRNRSISIIKEADHIIIIHDGKSKGTRNELDLIKRFGKPFTYYLIEIPKYNTVIDIEQYNIGEIKEI